MFKFSISLKSKELTQMVISKFLSPLELDTDDSEHIISQEE